MMPLNKIYNVAYNRLFINTIKTRCALIKIEKSYS